MRKKIDGEYYYLHGTCDSLETMAIVSQSMENQGFKVKTHIGNDLIPTVWIHARKRKGEYIPR